MAVELVVAATVVVAGACAVVLQWW
jgi:hypothetical protein